MIKCAFNIYVGPASYVALRADAETVCDGVVLQLLAIGLWQVLDVSTLPCSSAWGLGALVISN